jgi:septal ring factor EnvC (AmiA/AmiB activator)
MSFSTVAVLLCLSALPCSQAEVAVDSLFEASHANPIRKVVTMLQAMQKRVEAEGLKEKELFEKYMCYCRTSGGDLSKSISDAETKIPQVGSDIKEAEATLTQLKEDLKQHQIDKSAAKSAVADATALREKEAAEYAKEASESTANIAALDKAITAIEKGMAGGFLQTSGASVLRRLAAKQDLDEEDRQALNAFLQGSESEQYVPSSQQITGILKGISDEMTKAFSQAKAAEDAAIVAFEQLMAAKTKEINALTTAIENKMTRSGELSVAIVQMKNDLDDTQEALVEDKAFLKDMETNCAKKTAEWETITKTRNEELLALAETIKVLNDDDALELFKKALPGASSSFVQVNVNVANARAHALAAIRKAQQASKSVRPQLDFIAMAISGKKIGFEKVIKMIDDMVAMLKKEQTDDDEKKEYCAKQFDMSDDKKKGLERAVADLETVIDEAKDGISTTKSEIESLKDTIKALDKSVSTATDQRKEEHEDFTNLLASDSAAKELLRFARNRLNKFYNPTLYKGPPKRELTEDDRMTLAAGGTLAPTEAPSGGIAGTGITVLSEITAHSQGAAAPPPPPEAPGAYKKTESGGVIAMIDLLIKDLDKEMTEAKTEEKDSQADYESMMKDSAAKRADDSKTLTDKQGALADMEASLQSSTDNKGSTQQELSATLQYIQSLHAECDFVLKYFDVRAEARTSEIDSLGKAKAVLSGLDIALVQTKSRASLRGA